MFYMIVYLAFGVPGEHEGWASERVASFSSYEQCMDAAYDWFEAHRMPPGYEPRYDRAAPEQKGWFVHGWPDCIAAELVS